MNCLRRPLHLLRYAYNIVRRLVNVNFAMMLVVVVVPSLPLGHTYL